MPVSRVSDPATYAELKKAVEAVVFKGRQQIEQAWTRTYHETGRLINEHILRNQDRAGYGAKVFERLSTDTGISKRTLHECAQFHRCFPIVRTSAQLPRSHYILLCQVGDEQQRNALLREAIKHDWTVAQLTQRVRPLNAALETTESVSHIAETPPRLLTPKRGTPGVYRVVMRDDGLAVDLGFKLYVTLQKVEGVVPNALDFSAGDFVRFDSRGRVVAAADGAGKADLFTYAATVRRVVDGDTLEIEVKLPRGYAHVMKLRLRGIDCPEMDTAEGKAAKRHVEACFTDARDVTIYTTKPDKYDRYLADVFIFNGANDAAKPTDVFLNNALLQHGHAMRKDEYSLADWGT